MQIIFKRLHLPQVVLRQLSMCPLNGSLSIPVIFSVLVSIAVGR